MNKLTPKDSRQNQSSPFKNIFFQLINMPTKTKVIALGCIVFLLCIIFPVICLNLGTLLGKTVGTATGSFKAITEDIPNGLSEGKSEGLSAKDTEAEIVSKTHNIGKLEVLGASVKLTNFHSVGEKYAALYLMKANAIFSVDLNEATISFTPDHSEVVIVVPEPTVLLSVDENETEKLAEWQTKFFNGSADDGFNAYLNSMGQIVKNSTDSISNYDTLLDTAKASAQNQISLLVKEICGSNITVHITFAD